MLNSLTKYKEDCFAFRNYTHKTINSNKTTVETKVVKCAALNRDNCINCTFYKYKDEFDRAKVEQDILEYNPNRRGGI